MTISGSRFGTDPADVRVTFNGTVATVLSVTTSTIVALVPALAEGAATVVVTVNGRSSSSVTISVLRGLPVITGLSPSAVRQGGTITIQGQNFLAARRLAPAGAALEVLLDGEPLAAQSVTDTQIVVSIPTTISVGSHEIRLRRGEDLSNAVNVSVEVFTVTGTYELVGIITFNDCPTDVFEFAVGDTVASIVTTTDGRPNLTMTLRAPESPTGVPHSGTLQTSGAFEVSFASGASSSTVEGIFEIAPDGEVIVSGTAVIEDVGCRVELVFAAVRVSTSAGALSPGPASSGAPVSVDLGRAWSRR